MATLKKVPMLKSTAQLADAANPRNPRKITPEQLKMLADSLKRFGDLSGLVMNVKTGHLVGGHQRVKLLGEAPIEITKRYETPSPTGTIAEGYVLFEGERYVYRAVDWDEATENAAMIAANKHGGDWDFPMLSELLVELDQGDFDLGVTGFTPAELERMVRGMQPTKDDEITPLAAEDMNLMPAHIRMVQLFLTVETLPMFMDEVRALQERYKTENITDTVIQAVHRCYLLPADADTDQGHQDSESDRTRLPTAKRRTRKDSAPQNGGAE